MKDSYLQHNFANRIGGANFGKDQTVYKFEKIKRAKRAALAAHPGIELIDMGVGDRRCTSMPSRRWKYGRARRPPICRLIATCASW